MRAIVFHPEAREEFFASIDFYESQVDGLGIEFLEEIEDSVKNISQNPKAWRNVYRSIRKYIVHRFPYIIFYVSEPECIYIVAISHQKQKPGYWHSRV